MKKTIVIVLIVLIVAGAGGFFIGRAVESGKNKAENELNIQLKRSELEGLGKIEGTIYVTGHKSPDADTVVSAIAYATLLEKLGYDAQPVVLGGINKETAYVLGAAGAETPSVLDDASGKNIVLVDHSELSQTASGMESANIISIVDHHNLGTATSKSPLIYDARPIGATATVIWMRYRDYGVEIDKSTATLMLGAILSDTSNFKSGTTTSADKEAIKALKPISGISDTDAFYREMYKASISYDGMTDEEVFYSDYKEYESNGTHFCIGCVNAYDEDAAKALCERMKETMPKLKEANGSDLMFAQVSIFHDDISVTYIVPCEKRGAEIIEEAFGERAAKSGAYYRFEPGMSRKQVLVPAIMGVLTAETPAE